MHAFKFEKLVMTLLIPNITWLVSYHFPAPEFEETDSRLQIFAKQQNNHSDINSNKLTTKKRSEIHQEKVLLFLKLASSVLYAIQSRCLTFHNAIYIC